MRRYLVWGLAGVAAVAVLKGLLAVLGSDGVYYFSTPFQSVALGAITGMTYGLLAVGLVLIYRTNRIINFAHGQIGAFGAALFGLVVVKYHIPYWVMFPAALALSGAAGAATEAVVVRRLRNVPRVVSVVATLGMGQFLVTFATAVNSSASAGASFPEPSGLPSFSVGALRVTPAYSGMLILSPLLVAGLALFLRRSRFGLALRAAADNPEAARLSGITAARMSSLAWVVAGALSAFSAILTQPTQGFTSAESFGPALLLRAMTCAVVARMQSLPGALGAGVGLGVLESLLLWNYPQSGLVEMSLFVVILAALLLQRRRPGREEEKGAWTAVQPLRPVPEALRRIWLVRHLGTLAGLVALLGALGLSLVITNDAAVKLTGIMAFSIVGLSIVVLTGMGGQLTLGQFAVAAVGAVVSYAVSVRTGDFFLAILYAALAAGIVSVMVGLPALRIRGLMLTVTTLAFALATPAWLLGQPWMLGGGVEPGRPIVGGLPLDTGRRYYFFGLGLLVLCVLVVRNVRAGGLGRLLVSVRDNEDGARSFGVRASLVKVQAYFVAGLLAGVGGALYGHSLSNIGPSTFPVDLSIDVVVMAVLGGLTLTAGPLIGAAFVLGIPAFVPLDSAGLAATRLGALVLILLLPAGLGSLVEPLRNRIVARVARWHGVVATPESTPEAFAHATPAVMAPPKAAGTPPRTRAAPRTLGAGTELLRASGLAKSFGGVVAVRDVSLSVRRGQIVGLIGPNGAGKTTTFELLGGFSAPDSGRVVFDHRDVTDLGPETRARLGLIRSFQDAALFPTMTVTECVALAMERNRPSSFWGSLVGIQIGERDRLRAAREMVSGMGLEQYRDRKVRELSTGTRRITEIACLVALRPVLLMLDEPSSGIAQRETEALGGVLAGLRDEMGITMLVIEHDLPLVMSISDRMIVMADGAVIAAGAPDAVRADPVVVEAYLGGSVTAIERSGRRSAAGAR